jgi:Hypoxia induced protein conserved region
LRLPMQTILYHSTTIAVIAVFVVLLFGLYTMMRGSSPNLSQKVMRWRVGLQFVAIIIIMAAVYAKKHFVQS